MPSKQPSPVTITSHNTSGKSMAMLKVLEENLDSQKVSLNLMPIAIKSLDPVELIIQAATGYALGKFLLEPLIDPIAQKWKESVEKFFSPYRTFNITVNIKDGTIKKIYTEPPVSSLGGMIVIWMRIGQAQRVIAGSPLGVGVTSIQLVLEAPNKPHAIGYNQNQQRVCQLDLLTGEITR